MAWLSPLLDMLLWPAGLLALLSAYAGDRAARVLLLVLVLTLAMEFTDAPFHPLDWAQLDMLVALLVIRRGMPRRDMAVVLLILPAWGAYFLSDPWRHWVSTGIVIGQFLLTATAPEILRRARSVKLPHSPHLFDDFHLKVGS